MKINIKDYVKKDTVISIMINSKILEEIKRTGENPQSIIDDAVIRHLEIKDAAIRISNNMSKRK